MTAIRLHVSDVSVVSSRCDNPALWQAWAQTSAPAPLAETTPSYAAIPAGVRRRLSPLGRCALGSGFFEAPSRRTDRLGLKLGRHFPHIQTHTNAFAARRHEPGRLCPERTQRRGRPSGNLAQKSRLDFGRGRRSCHGLVCTARSIFETAIKPFCSRRAL